jgi:hypothetical protein
LKTSVQQVRIASVNLPAVITPIKYLKRMKNCILGEISQSLSVITNQSELIDVLERSLLLSWIFRAVTCSCTPDAEQPPEWRAYFRIRKSTTRAPARIGAGL